jgi:hypothetical protein
MYLRTKGMRIIGSVLLLISLNLINPNDPKSVWAGRDSTDDLMTKGWAVDLLELEGTDRPGVRHLRAEGRFNLPAEQVWEVIVGDRGSNNWPGIRESVLEQARGDTMIRRYALDVPIFPDRTYKLRMVRDTERMRLQFDRIPGYGNVNEIRGFWEVRAISPFESHVSYRLDTDPGVKLVPGFIVKWATKKAIPRSFAYIYSTATGSTGQSLGTNRAFGTSF